MPAPSSGLFRSSELTFCRIAPNPGVMRLEGTNSYLLGSPEAKGRVLVDPGPRTESHLNDLRSAGNIELVLITHRHPDHSESSRWFYETHGIPVRAFEASQCYGGPPLADGEVLHYAGVSIRVLATPGHTSDSVSFYLPQDGPGGSVITGDAILGRGTTVLCHPDGRLEDYLQSLRKLSALGSATVLPGHGSQLPDLRAVCEEYTQHRLRRLQEIEASLESLGDSASIDSITDSVYRGIDSGLRPAAEMSVAAQVEYLLRRKVTGRALK